MLRDDALKLIYNTKMSEELVLKYSNFDSGKDEFYCQLNWEQANEMAGFLPAAQMLLTRLDLNQILFASGDPFVKKNKPFTIEEVILDKNGYTIVVKGQRSERIARKWTTRLTQWFGLPVKLTWEV